MMEKWGGRPFPKSYKCAMQFLAILGTGLSYLLNFILFTCFCTSLCMYLFISVSRISKLGSGSDFEAYFQRLGIASGRARYTKNRVSPFILGT